METRKVLNMILRCLVDLKNLKMRIMRKDRSRVVCAPKSSLVVCDIVMNA